MPDLDTRFAKSESFISRAVGNGTVLIPVGETITDLDALYALNEVGSRLWELTDGEMTLKDLAARVAEEFGISAEKAQQDVLAFIEQLRDINAIQAVAIGGIV